jgi:maleylpyruvate isomerase
VSAAADPLRLHGYWRSTASYRVRIALGLKGLAYEQVAHDLRRNAHREPGYLALNPQGLVPVLETPDGVLSQSTAIIEWLEEVYPDPPLLPASPGDRAAVRAMAAMIACDIHPLGNLRVLRRLRHEYGCDEAQVSAWIAGWIAEGFVPLEALIAKRGGRYAFGDSLTMADCLLVPQHYGAERYEVDLTPYPAICAAVRNALEHPAVAAAQPGLQADAD